MCTMKELTQAISNRFNDELPHVIMPLFKSLSTEEWEKLGRPYTWVCKEGKIINGTWYRVFVDSGYGTLLLIAVNGSTIVEMDHGKHFARLPDAIAMDMEYYELHKYLWE